MIYDVTGEKGPNFPQQGIMVDALGRILHPLAWCDTETGEAGRYLVRPDGVWVLTDGRTTVSVGKYPAPLRRETSMDGCLTTPGKFPGDAPYFVFAPYLDENGNEFVPQ